MTALGDPLDLDAYPDGRAVFLVEDGESHWYVARDAGRALSAHISLMEPDDLSPFAVRRVLEYEVITLHLEERGDAKRCPDTFELVEPSDDCGAWRLRAYAGMWAVHLKDGEQICSTCF